MTYYQRNKEKIKENVRIYKLKNKEKTIRWSKERYEKLKSTMKDVRLRKDYNLSIKQYNEMLRNQNNVCAICLQNESYVNIKTKNIQDLSVDHDHGTGKIRGLLCRRCNLGLGYFKDNLDMLSAAIMYLKN